MMVRVASVSLVLSALFACSENLAPIPLDFAIAPEAVKAQSGIQLSLTVPATDPDGDDDLITYAVSFAMAADATADTLEAVEPFNRSGLTADELDGYCWAPDDYVPSADLSCNEDRAITDAGVEFVDGQVWEVTVEATDSSGLSSAWSPTYSFVVGNSAPVINSVSFQMKDADTADILTIHDGDVLEEKCPLCSEAHELGDLAIDVDASDVDGDNLKYTVSWTCDSVVGTWEDTEHELYETCATRDGCVDAVVPQAVEDVSFDAIPWVPKDELGPCQVWTATGSVSDEFSESNSVSGAVLVGDYRPVVSEVTLSSSNTSSTDQASLEDQVTCSWTYWDLEAVEGDGSGDKSTVTWHGCDVDEADDAVTYNEDAGVYYVTTTPAELECDKNNAVYCEVLPIDAEGQEGAPKESSDIAIINSKPSYADAEIQWVDSDGDFSANPSDLVAGRQLKCLAVGWNDDDTDDEEDVAKYSWSMGPEFDEYVIVSTGFVRDDEVTCTVTPFDGEEYGDPVTSEPVTIVNSPPSVSDVTIEGAASGDTFLGDELTCSYTFDDPDGDDEGQTKVQWRDGGTRLATSYGSGGSISIIASFPNGFEIDNIVACRVFPVDSPDGSEGDFDTSPGEIEIANQDPIVEVPEITANGDGGLGDTLLCTTTADDPDGDNDDLDWTYKWKDPGNVEFEDNAVSVTLTDYPSSDLEKGEDVTCTVKVTDPYGGKDSKTSSYTIRNSAPELSNGTIGISSGAGVTAVVTCSFDDADLDEADTVDVDYSWTLNSADLSGETDADLNLADHGVEQGDTIECWGTPDDGTDTGSPDFATYLVVNSPPEITDISISWEDASASEPGANDILTCEVVTDDADGDTVSLSYEWYQDSTKLVGETGPTLDLSTESGVAEGTVIRCEATPEDSQELGVLNAASVTVGNTPPTISAVQVLNDGDGSGFISARDSATCEVTSDDVDGDSITTTYRWLVDGVDTLLTDEAIVVLDAGATYDMTLTCEATVSDARNGETVSGAVDLIDASPQWDGTPSVSVTPDVAYYGDVLTCEHTNATDPDGAETYAYRWKLDGQEVVDAIAQSFSTLDSGAGPGIGVKCAVSGQRDENGDGSIDADEETGLEESIAYGLFGNNHPDTGGETVVNDELILISDYFASSGVENVYPEGEGIECYYDLCASCDNTSPPTDKEGHVLGEGIHWTRDPGDGSPEHFIGSWQALAIGPRHGCAYELSTESVNCWGKEIDGSLDGWDLVEPMTNGILKAGADYTCGIDLDEDIAACWGAAPGGVPAAKVANVPTSGIIDVAPGVTHTCWLLLDGSVDCAGDDTYGQATPPAGNEFTAVDAGEFHTCALDSSDLVTCWGIGDGSSEDAGQVTDAPTTDTFSSIDVGALHTCGVRSGTDAGQISCWGAEQSVIGGAYGNSVGSFTSVSSGTTHSCGITVDGEGVCWGTEIGPNVTNPYEHSKLSAATPFFTEVAEIAAGYGVTCMRFDEGGYVCYEDSIRLHSEGVTAAVAYPPIEAYLDGGYVDGDMVGCILLVTDVYGQSAVFSSEQVTIGSGSGSVSDVCVEWDSIDYQDQVFNCFSDADSGYETYTWTVFNGSGSAVYGPLLGSAQFSPYTEGVNVNDMDTVECEVAACGPGCPTASDSVYVDGGSVQCEAHHSPPYLTSLCVTTDLVGTQLTCSATAADAEGDPITIDYQWTVTDLTGQETYSTDQSITYDPMSTGSAMCEATPSDTFEYGNPVSVDAELSVDGSVCADLGLTASVDFGGATCLEEGRSNVGCDYTLHGFDSITETDASFVEYTLNGVPAERYEQLEAGIDHACAIESSTGAVHCWGDIHGSVASDAVLISFSDPGEGGFFASLDVGAGDDHGVAITVEETSGTWGIASGGGSMVSGTSVAVVAGDDFTCTLASNGALDCFGDQVIKNAVDADNTANLTTYSALAAGHGSGAEGAVCGIRTNIPQGEDSSLKCFDKSSNSTLLKTDVPAGTDWVFVSVAARSACAVDSANSMQCWGPNVPTAGVFSDVEQGVMSENGGCRVSTDGNLQCLYGGAGAAPEAPPPGQYTDIVSGFAGGSYFCATSVAGTIHCWGTAAPATHSTETVYMAPGLGELQDGDTLECTVTPCADDGSSETCGDPVTAMIQVADTCP